MCFVCGLSNPFGLKMAFYEDHAAGEVRTEVTVPDVYQGYPGVVHGGIVAAILDEVSARAVFTRGNDDEFMTTVRLTIRYRQPTPTETPLVGVGRVLRTSGIGARVAGEIRLPDGTVSADCECLLSHTPDEVRAKWAAEMPYWRVYE
jgi:acyl-coenzyme A thioesterase PaaI-like protein